MNIRCWFLGHDVVGKIVEKSHLSARTGELWDCWHEYCQRCQSPNSFPINQFPDRRNLYQRTIPILIIMWRNQRHFRNVQRDFEINIKAYLRHLDEQLKIYGPRPRCLFGDVKNFNQFFFADIGYLKLPRDIISREGIWGNVLSVPDCKLWKFENHVEIER